MIKSEDMRAELMSIVLLIFLLVVAGFIWFLDPLTQQTTFGLFVAVELVAFAMLVYITYKGNFDDISKPWLFLAGAVIIYLMLLSAFIS
jgi:hypothetical protein